MEPGFGPALRSERKRLGHSLQEFAEFLGTSVATLKRWEAGTSIPTEAKQESLFECIRGGGANHEEPEGIHLGWIIKIERLAAQLSIRQAAECCSLPPSSWHRYETGQSALGKRQAERLIEGLCGNAEALGVKSHPQLEWLRDHRELAMENPIAAARMLMRRLLSGSKNSVENHLQRFEEWQSLAIALMHMGDHDLSGRAHRLATQHGRALGVDPAHLASVHIGAAWIGFPAIKERALAAERLRWMDNKIMQLPLMDQPGFSIMRAMFIDFAGYPNLAHEVLRHAPKDDLQTLSLAWMEAKYGRADVAASIAEQFLGHESPKHRFIANKVLLECLLLKEDLDSAREALSRLKELRNRLGFWSPDIAKRTRRLAL